MNRARLLAASVFLAAGVSTSVACTGLLGDFDVAAGAGDNADGSTDTGSPVDTGLAVDTGAQDAKPADVGADAPSADTSTPDAAPFDANYYGSVELWVSADFGVTAAGGVVSAWKDRSAVGRTVSVPSGSTTCQAGPALVPSSLHGLPTVTFNGSTQCMTVSGSFTAFTNGLTAFVVLQPEACNSTFLGNSAAVFDSYDNTTSTYTDGVTVGRNPTPAQNPTGDGQLVITNGTSNPGTVAISGGGSWVPGTPEVLEFRLPAAGGGTLVAGTAYVNGTAATLGKNDPFVPNQTNRTTTFLGYNNHASSSYGFYCGAIAEMIVFSKALTDADRVAVEGYLRKHWQL